MTKDTVEKKIIKYYSSKIRERPKSFLFLPLADSYRRRGMPETAIDICKRGLAHHPTYMAAKALLGELYFVCKRYDAAERELKEVIVNKPQNLLARKIMVGICNANGMYKDALKWSEQLVDVQPDSTEFLAMKEAALEKMKNMDENEFIQVHAPPVSEKVNPKSALKEQGKLVSEETQKQKKIKTIEDLQKLYSGLHDVEETVKSKDQPEKLLHDEEAFDEISNLFKKNVLQSNEPVLQEHKPLELFEKMLSNLNDKVEE